MKLIAEVKHIAVHGIHKVCTAYLPTGEVVLDDLPDPIRAEIEIGDDGTCMMYCYSMGDMFCGDTWHETLEDAKMNAAFEYDISEADWSIAEPGIEMPGSLLPGSCLPNLPPAGPDSPVSTARLGR